MSRGIPDNISKEIRERVFQEADRVNYLARNTTDNNIFITNLVALAEVEGKLCQFINKSDIRTYIKDGILHRYSEQKAKKNRPDKLEPIITQLMGIDVYFSEYEIKSQINLFKSPANCCFIVVADGTILKWETALRKALLYITAKPLSDQKNMKTSIILTLFARNQKVPPSDMRHLQNALLLCNAIPYVYGEG